MEYVKVVPRKRRKRIKVDKTILLMCSGVWLSYQGYLAEFPPGTKAVVYEAQGVVLKKLIVGRG
jgi:hypothetical protein